MNRSAITVIILALCGIVARAQDNTPPALVKQKAQEVGQAIIKGDYAKIADLTYPKVVEAMGGREKMIAFTEAAMKQIKDQGFTVRAFTISEPTPFLTEGPNTFTVLPTAIEMTNTKGKIVGKSYLLGISPDGGKSWKFADGSGLESEEMRKLLPKLPAKLTLPAKQKPEFTPNP
jgi:hypothetical protein